MKTYCFFSAQYLPTSGGVERYTYNMAKELIRRGNKVIVVTSMLPECKPVECTDENIIIYRVNAKLLFNGRLPISAFDRSVRNVLKELKTYKIDRVVVQTRLYTLSVIGAFFARKENIPCIVIEHGTSYVGMSNALVQLAEIIYEKCLLMVIRRMCSNFCAVSREGAKWLRRFNIKALSVLYNSVDEGEEEDVCFDVRQQLGIDKQCKIITFVGRLIPEKGIVQLVDAVAGMKENVVLVVAGDGPLLEKFKKQTWRNIFFLGNLEHKKVISLLKQSDIYCLPSDSEGFPTGVVEAVICKCMTVIAPYGGAKELVKNENYGIVMQDNSKMEIEKCLEKAINLSDEDRKRIVDNVYKRFLKGFTWEKTCDNLEKLAWEKIK